MSMFQIKRSSQSRSEKRRPRLAAVFDEQTLLFGQRRQNINSYEVHAYVNGVESSLLRNRRETGKPLL
jgi:hypothetical protein